MAETTIHGIEFQIKGSSNDAATAIEKLANSLKALKSVTGRGLGIGSAAGELKALAEAVNGLKSFSARGLASLANSIFTLSAAAKSVQAGSGERLSALSAGLRSFEGTGSIEISPYISSRLLDLAAAADLITEQQINNIMAMGQALKVGLGSIEEGLAERVREISDALRSLASARIGTIDKDLLTSLDKFSQVIRKFTTEDITKIAVLSGVMKGLNGIKLGLTGDAVARLQAFIEVVYAIDEETLNKLERFIQIMQSLSSVNLKGLTKSSIGALQQLVDGGGGQSAADSATRAVDSATKRVSAIGRLYQKIGGIKGIGKGALGILTAPAKGSIALLQRQVGLVGDFGAKIKGVVGGFKRIAGYRLLRTIIKEITQGFQEGTKNLYEWSTLVGGTFAKNMDDAATSMLYFENSVGAAWSPLMNVLAPAIRAVTDAAVDLLNIINQLIARLTGQTSWTRAKRVATEYGDAVAGAGQAAKEAMRYLAPFDELNVLPDDKDRGGGGGAANNVSEMFEEVATFDEGISDFADKVREAIQSSNWTGLGVLLGEKVNEVVDSLDWSGAGTKVGKGINAWFTTKYWTLETVNFQNIGSKIAEFLNNAVSNIDFNIIGRSLTQQFTNFGDLVIGAVSNIDWGGVGNSIRDFIVGAFNQMSQWGKKIDWNEFGTTLYNSLTDLLSGLDFGSIASSFFSLLGTALGAGVSLISGFLSGLWEDIKSYFTRFIDTDAENDVGQQVVWGLLAGVWNAVKELGSWVKEHIFDPFLAAVKKVFGIHSPATEMEEPGQMIGEGILEGITKPFKAIKDWVKEHILDPIKDALSGFSISKLLFGDGEEGTDSGDASGETTIDIKAKLTKVGEWSQDVVDVVKEKGGEVKKTVKAIVDKAQGWVKEAGDALLSPDSVTKTVSTAVNKAKEWVVDAANAVLAPNAVTKTVSTAIDKAKTWVKEAADIVLSPNAITKTVSTAVDKAKTWVKEAADVVFSPNAVTKTVSTALDKAKTWVADAWTAITQPGAKSTTVTASVLKGKWVKDAWAATKLKASSITKKVTSTVNKGKTFVQDAFTAAKMKASSIIRSVASAVSKGNWDGEAYKVSTLTTGKVTRDVTANAKKGSINQNAYNVLTARGGYVDMYANITSLTNGLGYDPSLSATAYFDSYSDGFYDRPSINVDANIVGLTGADNIYPGAAKGGILSNGIWRSIPQYAGGTSRAHGSLFVAGEAGPEVVGHIGGRTEVLNRSQLAATMYSAVSRAIMGVRFNISTMNTPETSGYDEEAMYRAMLRALNDSDAFPDEIDLDGDVVYRKMVKRNQMNTRMTGRNAMATA